MFDLSFIDTSSTDYWYDDGCVISQRSMQAFDDRQWNYLADHWQMQTGNRWNSGELPWLFYIDVGLELHGVPPKAGAKGLWRRCHAVGSMSALCAGLRQDFAAQPDMLEQAGKQVAEAIPILSRAVASQVQQVRIRALEGFLSPLPVPTSWGPSNAA